jgi:hypothetical protein
MPVDLSAIIQVTPKDTIAAMEESHSDRLAAFRGSSSFRESLYKIPPSRPRLPSNKKIWKLVERKKIQPLWSARNTLATSKLTRNTEMKYRPRQVKLWYRDLCRVTLLIVYWVRFKTNEIFFDGLRQFQFHEPEKRR